MNLCELVSDGDVAALKAALADGAYPNACDDSGETPLMVAAGLGADEMVEILLDAGADLSLANDYGFDALGSALWCSHLPLARRLVERGAPVTVECAAALGDLARIEREWSTMPPIEETIGAYLGACRTGQVDVVRWFLDHGVPVDLHPPGNEWGGIGCSGLHHAAVNGHADLVKLLLARGSDVTLVDDVHGSQALAWASGAGNDEVAALLVDAGADLTHQNVHGLTAEELARRSGFDELARWLSSRPGCGG